MKAGLNTSRSRVILCAVALMIALGFTLTKPAHADRAGKKQDIVFIGDSLSDTGNRFFDEGSMNTPPYALAASENLIPSLPYAIGGPTYTNGQVWVEYVARAIGRGGASQAALRSNGIASNYAYAGARASNALPLLPNTNRNLGDQVVQYIADVGPKGISADTLHVILIGGNDIGDAIFLASLGGDPSAVLQNAIESIFNNALGLAEVGARRFLFLTTPNAGYIPAFGGNLSAIFLGDLLASALNCAVTELLPTPNCPPGLPATVAGTLTALYGAEVTVFDSKALLDDMILNPGNYGLSNTSEPCIKPFEPPFSCKKPDEYLYWDNIHPTAKVHEIIGKAVVDALSN